MDPNAFQPETIPETRIDTQEPKRYPGYPKPETRNSQPPTFNLLVFSDVRVFEPPLGAQNLDPKPEREAHHVCLQTG